MVNILVFECTVIIGNHLVHRDLTIFICFFLINFFYLKKGGEPIPIARGGFSGVFPESSQFANKMALTIGLPTTVLLCNLQLTKDNVGICLTDITLENSTTVSNVFPKGKKTHKVNGQDKDSWFVLDYSMDVIFNNLSRK